MTVSPLESTPRLITSPRERDPPLSRRESPTCRATDPYCYMIVTGWRKRGGVLWRRGVVARRRGTRFDSRTYRVHSVIRVCVSASRVVWHGKWRHDDASRVHAPSDQTKEAIKMLKLLTQSLRRSAENSPMESMRKSTANTCETWNWSPAKPAWALGEIPDSSVLT